MPFTEKKEIEFTSSKTIVVFYRLYKPIVIQNIHVVLQTPKLPSKSNQLAMSDFTKGAKIDQKCKSILIEWVCLW